MISSEFAEKLHHFPYVHKNFAGVFSIDTIPSTLKTHQFIICNTDVSSAPGKHWFCVLKEKPSILECFDSLGIDETKRKIIKEAIKIRGIKEIKINVTPLQSDVSISCGLFVLYFIIQRFHNRDLGFCDFLNSSFVESVTENELKVTDFCKAHF